MAVVMFGMIVGFMLLARMLVIAVVVPGMVVVAGMVVPGILADRFVGPAAGGGVALAAAATAAAARLALFFFLVRVLGVRVEQRLPVAYRDLVIVGMDLGEGEEAVPVAAVVDERRLQRRFDPGDLGEVDIAAQLPLVGGFEVEFLNPAAAQDDDPSLLGMRRIDKHLVGH